MTDQLILVAAAVLVVYDIAAAFAGWPTLSHEMKKWGETDNLWCIPLGWATLFGHFFIPSATMPLIGVRTLLVVVLLGGCVALNLTLLRTAPIWLTAMAGLALGAGLWGQGR